MLASNKSSKRQWSEVLAFPSNNYGRKISLVQSVELLSAYLRSSRPAHKSELVFIGIKNNYHMISASQIHSTVSKYFKFANLDITRRKHGPHALRHSLASNLLKNNTPMYVIKDVLGHTNLNTTKMYLNIDFNTLKNFALEVPDEYQK